MGVPPVLDLRCSTYNWILKHTLFRGHHPNSAILAMFYYDLTRKKWTSDDAPAINACAWLACKIHKEMGENGGKEQPVAKTSCGQWIFWNNFRLFSESAHGKTKKETQSTMLSTERQLLKFLGYRCIRETVYTTAYWEHFIPFAQTRFGLKSLTDLEKWTPLWKVHALMCALCVISMFVFEFIDKRHQMELAKTIWLRTVRLSNGMKWTKFDTRERENTVLSQRLNRSIVYTTQNGLYRSIMSQIHM